MKQPQFYIMILFLGFGFPVEAQNIGPTFKLIDTTKIKCTYQFRFLMDSTKMQYNNNKDSNTIKIGDLYVVNIGENITQNYCYQTFYVDSIDSTPAGRQKRANDLSDFIRGAPDPKTNWDLFAEYSKGMNEVWHNRGFFQFYLYKDYKEEKITVRDNISTNAFYYEDELKPQDWTILEDTMTILDYTCQKAICSWRGRDWVAWFASDIPINEGPWKFYGLPGLIMKLEDTELHYSFTMIGLQRQNEPMYMHVGNNNSRKINRLSFLRLKMNRTGTDLVAMDLAKVGISGVGSWEHYDHIERDYK